MTRPIRAHTAAPLLVLSLAAACRDHPVGALPAESSALTEGRSTSLAAAGSGFEMTDLGAFGVQSEATGINGSGHVVGTSSIWGNVEHAFLWTLATGMLDLGTPHGLPEERSSAADINEAGTIVGTSYRYMDLAFSRSSAGEWQTLALGNYQSTAAAVNSKGEVVGRYMRSGGGFSGFLYRPGTGLVDLNPTASYFSGDAHASDINDSSVIVGISWMGDPVRGAFIMRYPGPKQPFAPGGLQLITAPAAINNAGQVVGSHNGRAFVWDSAGGVRYLPGPASGAADINDAGWIAGSVRYDGQSLPQAALWIPDGTGGYILAVLSNSYSSARAISPTGVVVGRNWFGDSNRAALWRALPATPPAAPSHLDLQLGVTGTAVDLSWSDRSADELSFQVVRSTRSPDGTFPPGRTIGSVPPNTTAYSDTAAVPGATYRYEVSACNVAGCTPSEAHVFTVVPAPAAPTGTAATIVAGRVRLTWTDASANESLFRIQRSTRAPDGTFPPYQFIGTAPAGATAYLDTTAAVATPYRYRVLACNASCAPSAPALATVPLPTAADLRATALSASRVEVTWAAAGPHETSFRVLRSTRTNGSFPQYASLAVVSREVNAFTDETAQPGNTYRYVVEACVLAACTRSVPVGVDVPRVPAAPSALQAVLVSARRVDLTWTSAASNGSYRVRRSTRALDGTYLPYETLATLRADLRPFFADSGVAAGSAYRYQVQACNASGCASSEVVHVTVPQPPTAPAGVTTRVGAAARVDVRWTDASTSETSFRVRRSTRRPDGTFAPFQTMGSVGPGSTAFSDHGVVAGNTYRYVVDACRVASCASSPSAVVTVPAP